MPDLGDLLSFDDFSGGDYGWLDALANLGADAGDLGNMVLDTVTGELVDISTLSPQDLADLDAEGLTGGGSGQFNLGPSSTSTSDHLRSLQADPTTPGSEPFNWDAMADPSASIASAGGGSDWAKAIAQGLGNALGGLGSGLKGLGGLAAPAPGGSLPGLSGMGTASTPSAPGLPSAGGIGGLSLPDAGSVGGLASLGRPGMQDPISAALMQGQARMSPFAMQTPIDPGPAPRPFTPLALPTAGAGVPMAQAPIQRLSGLQRLALERLG